MRSPHRLLLLLSVFVLWSAFQTYKHYQRPQDVTRHSPVTSAVAKHDTNHTMASALKFLTVAARAKHTATVIFIHVSVKSVTSILKNTSHLGHGRVLEILDMAGNQSPQCWVARLHSSISSGFCHMRKNSYVYPESGIDLCIFLTGLKCL